MLLVCFSGENLLSAATVKKKNGQVVEGEINGLIVQKGEVKQSKEGTKTEYIVSYSLWNGKEIVAIDEEGVHIDKGSTIISVVASRKNEPPDDTEFLEKAVNMGEGAVLFGYLYEPVDVIRTSGRTGEPTVHTETLLGVLVGENKNGKKKVSIIPALEIITEKGIVKIPVNEIVEFKQKSEEQDEQKKK